MPPILAADDVDFCYADGTRALSALTLAFAEGRRTALLGRNGAGKSTLLTLCNGIERPNRGVMSYAGTPVAYDRRSLRDLRRRVGLVFQEPDSQLFSASIREDVSFGPLNLGLSTDEVRQRVERALATVHLADLADRPTHALSHGEKKRACLAGVLAMEPEVLILDEPTAGLDPPMTAELLTLLDLLHEGGCTVITATHDVDFAFAWADDICVLHEGTVAFQGEVADYPAACRSLPEVGLRLPLVFELFEGLRRRGLACGESPPRTRDELLARLIDSHP